MQTDERQGVKLVPFRGSVIGGQALADRTLAGKPYPYDIYAHGPVEFIEWDLQDIYDITAEVPALQAAFFSMLIQDIVKGKTSKHLEVYQAVLEVVVADNFVSSEEEALIDSARKRFGVSEQEHFNLLGELGWTRQRWEQSCDESRRPQQSKILLESVTQIENLVKSMKATLSSR